MTHDEMTKIVPQTRIRRSCDPARENLQERDANLRLLVPLPEGLRRLRGIYSGRPVADDDAVP